MQETLESTCQRISKKLETTNRPPVRGEEGYGLYMWLCEQDHEPTTEADKRGV